MARKLTSPLNQSYTFENFVVGASNQFAYTLAKAISENPGKPYNPLFIYGNVGLGKTHLLNSIGNALERQGKKVVYVTIEGFLNDFTLHLKHKDMISFREKYRRCDILMIDDFQFVTKKIATQEEFFHTFNEFYNSGKQIVFAADRAPKYIHDLENGLKSRLLHGVLAEIDYPAIETRIEIVKTKAALDNITLPQDVVEYIAENLSEKVREIEGVLMKINAFSKMLMKEITLDFSKDVLSDNIVEKAENITIEKITGATCRILGIKESEVCSNSRVHAIAGFFNMKNHTTISHAMKKIKADIDENHDLQATIERIADAVKERAKSDIR